MPPPPTRAELVRSFNRFYTQQIGLLREGYLQSPFTLTQARVIYELAHEPGVRSTDLVRSLGIDPGYLSRLLHSFEQRHLIKRAVSKQDRRASELSLTASGRNAYETLNTRSDEEIGKMLANLAQTEQETLVASMTKIRELLGPKAADRTKFTIRTHRAGDIGWVVARHGELYAQEYQWDSTFEGLVAEITGKFLVHFDEQRERCWIAERECQRLGCVFLVKQSKGIAKLRLLLVEPCARGIGVGKQLVAECIAFARAAGYRKLTLWTNDVLIAARKIYQRAGFELVKEEKHHSFGHDLVGQFWELDLQGKA